MTDGAWFDVGRRPSKVAALSLRFRLTGNDSFDDVTLELALVNPWYLGPF